MSALDFTYFDITGAYKLYQPTGSAPEWEIGQGTRIRAFSDTTPPPPSLYHSRRLKSNGGTYQALHSWSRTPLYLHNQDRILQTNILGTITPSHLPSPPGMDERCLIRVHNRHWLSERTMAFGEALSLSLQQLITPFEVGSGPQTIVSITCSWATVLLAVDLAYVERIPSMSSFPTPFEYAALLDDVSDPNFLNRQIIAQPNVRTQRPITWVPNYKRTITLNVSIRSRSGDSGHDHPFLSVSTGCGDYGCWPWYLDAPRDIIPMPRRLILPDSSVDIRRDPLVVGTSQVARYQTVLTPLPLRHRHDWTIDLTPHGIMGGAMSCPNPPAIGNYHHRSWGDPKISFTANTAPLLVLWEAMQSVTYPQHMIDQPPHLRISSIRELEWAHVRISNMSGSIDKFVPLVVVLRHWTFVDLVKPFRVVANAYYMITVTAPGLVLVWAVRLPRTYSSLANDASPLIVPLDYYRRRLSGTSLHIRGFLTWATHKMTYPHSSPLLLQRQQHTVVRLVMYPQGTGDLIILRPWDRAIHELTTYELLPIPVHLPREATPQPHDDI